MHTAPGTQTKVNFTRIGINIIILWILLDLSIIQGHSELDFCKKANTPCVSLVKAQRAAVEPREPQIIIQKLLRVLKVAIICSCDQCDGQ